MFNKKIDYRMIDPSSKMTLKLSCLSACSNDIDKAKKLYDFMIEGLENIPDYPMPRPSVVQQFTQQAESLFGWVDQNADKLMKGYNIFQAIRGNAVLPIQTAETAASAALPEIPPLPPLE